MRDHNHMRLSLNCDAVVANFDKVQSQQFPLFSILFSFFIFEGQKKKKMNRYESAYRDYTIQRGDESSLYHQPPQRPERSNNNKGVRLVGTAGGGNRSTAAAAAAAAIVESSESSIESTSYDQSRMMIPQQQQQVQINQGFSTDEESFILQRYHPHHHHQQQQHQQHHHHHHQISSRELSDRSGGERSNPDFLVANDAIQSYPARYVQYNNHNHNNPPVSLYKKSRIDPSA